MYVWVVYVDIVDLSLLKCGTVVNLLTFQLTCIWFRWVLNFFLVLTNVQ